MKLTIWPQSARRAGRRRASRAEHCEQANAQLRRLATESLPPAVVRWRRLPQPPTPRRLAPTASPAPGAEPRPAASHFDELLPASHRVRPGAPAPSRRTRPAADPEPGTNCRTRGMTTQPPGARQRSHLRCRTRRNAELLLLCFATVITIAALAIVEANQERGPAAGTCSTTRGFPGPVRRRASGDQALRAVCRSAAAADRRAAQRPGPGDDPPPRPATSGWPRAVAAPSPTSRCCGRWSASARSPRW